MTISPIQTNHRSQNDIGKTFLAPMKAGDTHRAPVAADVDLSSEFETLREGHDLTALYFKERDDAEAEENKEVETPV
jgi:hypothetical protein